MIVSEAFSMRVKAAAASAATAVVFAAGAVTNVFFLSLHSWLGSGSFVLFGLIAWSGGLFVAARLPETKGRSLAEVQLVMAEPQGWRLLCGMCAGEREDHMALVEHCDAGAAAEFELPRLAGGTALSAAGDSKEEASSGAAVAPLTP